MRTTPFVKAGLCLGLVFVTFFIGCCTPFGDAPKAKASRSDELSAPLAGITALDVTSDVGKINIAPGEAADVHVTADITVKARTQEEADELLDGVRILAEPSVRTLTVKAVKPPGFGRNQLSVDFTITAPPGLALDCTTDVGSIRIHRFTERVKAYTDVGSITCTDLHGAADLRADVGDITVAYAPAAPADVEVTATTDVGSIDFTGPEQISAQITAAVDVGSIHTDRPLTVQGLLKKSITATVGNGDGRINLRTDVGSISIR